MNQKIVPPKTQRLILTLAGSLFLIVLFSYALLLQRGNYFDDAFITYRYAKHLASGQGITWNVGQAPTEGYTNFFLVLLLAPFIKLGFAPFAISQILNVLALLLTAAILYRAGREFYNQEVWSAILAASLIFQPLSGLVAMLGLETCLYAMGLTLTVILCAYYLKYRRSRYLAYCGLSSLATFWLRPEGLLLVGICLLYLLVRTEPKKYPHLVRPLFFSFLLPLLLYLAWKYWYFGSLFPNPFYLKVSGSFLDPAGTQSVVKYLFSVRGLLFLALISFFIPSSDKHLRWLSGLFVLTDLVFFCGVHTLMDMHKRFLFPLTPLLILLALPALAWFFRRLLDWGGHIIFKVLLVILFCFLIVSDQGNLLPGFTYFVRSHGRILTLSDFVMNNKEQRLALQLAKYPAIKQLKLALPDAGVIPYYTDAVVLDVVGLNDSFIARNRNLTQLRDYFFAQKPDLAFLPALGALTWLRNGHGPLGNYINLAADSRWRNYFYAGTIEMDQYDYHLFIRKSYPQADALRQFLRKRIINNYYQPFSLPIGYRDF